MLSLVWRTCTFIQQHYCPAQTLFFLSTADCSPILSTELWSTFIIYSRRPLDSRKSLLTVALDVLSLNEVLQISIEICQTLGAMGDLTVWHL